MHRLGNEYRSCVLGDLDGWIGDWARADINGAFEVPGKNENGISVLEFCGEGGCLWVTHTSNTRVCISTRGWQWVKMEGR